MRHIGQISLESSGDSTYVTLPSGQAFVRLELPLTTTAFALTTANDEQLTFSFNADNKSLLIDRSGSGEVRFSEAFTSPIVLDLSSSLSEVLTLDLWIDVSSVELFVNGGEQSATLQYFSSEPMSRLFYEAVDSGITVKQLAGIEGIW